VKWLAPLVLLTSVSSAHAEDRPLAVPEQPANAPWSAHPSPPRNCRDTIHTARAELGLPLLRDNARPADDSEAMLILAVDREIEGCDVLVMASDPRDFRPLPAMPESHEWRVRPAQ